MSAPWGDSSFLGADPEELDRLAASMGAHADLLVRHRGVLNALLHEVPWIGELADGFRNEWATSHMRIIADAAALLQTTRNALLRRADEQRKASAADSTGSAGVVIGTSASGVPLQGGSGTGLQGGDAGALQGGSAVLLGAAGIAVVGAKQPATESTQRVDGTGNGKYGKPGDSTGALPAATKADYEAVVRRHSDPKWGELDQWNKAGVDQCTSWVAFRRSQFGLSVPYGNGGDMGHDPHGTPTLGALASYFTPASQNGGKEDAFGHVMFVEQVMAPDRFRVSEMNWDRAGGFRDSQIWDRLPSGDWKSETTGAVRELLFTP